MAFDDIFYEHFLSNWETFSVMDGQRLEENQENILCTCYSIYSNCWSGHNTQEFSPRFCLFLDILAVIVLHCEVALTSAKPISLLEQR